MNSTLKSGKIQWRGGVPVAQAFDDPYYSLEDGLAESRYVFLDGTNALEKAKFTEKFVIGETGFGTGLNFLATWHAWRENNMPGRLVFVSAEAYPLNRDDLTTAHSAFPELEPLARQLRDAWPPNAKGFHPRYFDDGQVSLLLLFDIAEMAFEQLNAQIDAWYLDGFAPARNPDMWTERLFARIASLSAPSATLATFTAAGFVKRGLSAHGFQMQKTRGFGRKRDRLVGRFIGGSGSNDDPSKEDDPSRENGQVQHRSWAQLRSAKTDHIAIIGGGIAAASTAHSLKLRGKQATLVHPEDNLLAASKLPAAILAPRFLLDDQPERGFFNAAFAFAVTHPTFQNAFAIPRGLACLAYADSAKNRHQNIVAAYAWSDEWMKLDQDNLLLPKGGTVDPEPILKEMTMGLPVIAANIVRLEKSNNSWILTDIDGRRILEAETVVLAAGPETINLMARSEIAGNWNENLHPRLQPNVGQIEIVDNEALFGVPEHTISYGGYVSAALGNDEGRLFRTIGSTFERLQQVSSNTSEPREADRQKILAQFTDAVDGGAVRSADISSWRGVRATVADHLPYAGPIPDWSNLEIICGPLKTDATKPVSGAPKFQAGLYCLAGLGSKGFQYGPLLGEYIAAMITGDPIPVPQNLVEKLHPSRSLVKAIIQGHTKGS